MKTRLALMPSARAAHCYRSMWKEELEREYRSLVADKEVVVVPVLGLAHGAASRRTPRRG